MAGLPRIRARVCRVAPHENNVKVTNTTRALLKMPGRPQRGISGGGHAPRGAMLGLSYPVATSWNVSEAHAPETAVLINQAPAL